MSSTSFSSTKSLGGNYSSCVPGLVWLLIAGQVDDEGEPGIFRFVHIYLI
jgi:hypothetical protein